MFERKNIKVRRNETELSVKFKQEWTVTNSACWTGKKNSVTVRRNAQNVIDLAIPQNFADHAGK